MFKDLSGLKFGMLTVLRFVGYNKFSHQIWECVCDCGNSESVHVLKHHLTKSNTISCGCNKNQVKRKYINKYYTEESTYFIEVLDNKNTSYGCITIDPEDKELCGNYIWYIQKGKHTNYAVCSHKGKTIKMHRLIKGIGGSFIVDHIDGNGLNNTRSNLRVVSSQQNAFNRALRSDNSSGIAGVYFNLKKCKWVSQIKIDGKNITLGEFKEKCEAVKIRRIAELVFFGDYRRTAS